MGVFKLGGLIKFIPYTIVTGFTSGIAVTIVIGQIKDFLGLEFKHAPIETMEKLKECIDTIGTINAQALSVGLIALAILIVWPKINAKIPPSLIAVIVTIVLVKGLIWRSIQSEVCMRYRINFRYRLCPNLVWN